MQINWLSFYIYKPNRKGQYGLVYITAVKHDLLPGRWLSEGGTFSAETFIGQKMHGNRDESSMFLIILQEAKDCRLSFVKYE